MFNNWHLIRRLFPYMRPYKGRAILLVILTMLAALFALAAPWPLALMIDSVLSDDAKPFPGVLSFLGNRSVTTQILFSVMLGFGFVLLDQFLTVCIRAVDTRLELGMVLDFRSHLFEHIQKLSFQYHDQAAAGRFIYQVNYFAHDAGSIPTSMLPLAQAALTIVGMFVITYLLHPQLAFAALVVVPFVYMATMYYGKLIEPALEKVRNLEGDSMSIVHEKISIVRVVVSFCREKYELKNFQDQGRLALNSRVQLTIRQTIFSLGVALVMAVGTGLVLYIGAHAVQRGQLEVGQLTAVLAYVIAVYRPLEQITNSLASLQQQLIQMQMVFNVLDAEPDVKEKPDAIELTQPVGRVEMRDVVFRYDTRERTLDDISFTVEPGEFVAIVGPTGAGKSTLVSLIPRFFDPREGAVLIDGHDVRDLTLESVRGSISVVMQEPILFMGTIADNIRYGKLDATEEEVVAAAKAANAHDFISNLPDAYSTTVGERGARISGGERQRIAVARAFLKDAPILVLDEPTSSIDSRTEAVILDALERLAEGRTTIMIAHRMSTIRLADRILVMDHGRLVESGTHRELLSSGGMYQSLWDAQAGVAVPVAELTPGTESPDGEADPADDAEPQVIDGEFAEPVLLDHTAEIVAAGATLDPAPVEVPILTPARPAHEAIGAWEATAVRLAPAAVARLRRPKVVVLGMMTKIPVAGVVWQTMHYLVGLERLGVEVYYVEAHARTPSMFMERETDDGSARAAAFIDETMNRFGLAGRWAFHALHDDGAVYGMTAQALSQLYVDAAIIINLHGGTEPLPEHAATGRLVYLETDPVQLQIELYENNQTTLDFLEPHVAFFTFGENYGRPDCGLPVSDRFQFLPTRQPVVRDFWESFGTGPELSFTTIGNWRQPWREVKFKGETYQWSKHLEFLRFMDVPRRTRQRFELALSSYSDEDRRMLESNGWHIAHALDFSIGLDSYRSYVGGSRGEFTVAKDQNIRLRTGWFSDRSATYLAAGRPVITQDTGFGNVLPTGEGLFAFSTSDDVVAAVEDINGDYERHRRAAQEISREFFDFDVVLRPLLSEVGISLPSKRPTRSPDSTTNSFLVPELDMSVVRRRPTTLTAETAALVLAAPVPTVSDRPSGRAPRVSIIVVTFNNLLFSRLCLESVLANSDVDDASDIEIVVVDNASSDMTPAYLDELARQSPRIKVQLNDVNVGFAAAVNQGIARSTGETLVLLNNDTVVAPGWIDRLLRHLDDPTVAMVGPLTNAAPNEARVNVSYTTYGGFLEHAARVGTTSQPSFDIDVLTMFCVAMRRDVYERLGPLDEQFEVGMFEDDDYAMRIRSAGLRSVCATDVIVHHFGEASFGKLVPTGEHNRLFTANRQRFEAKWQMPWTQHRSAFDSEYTELVAHVCDTIAAVVPEDATILMVSKGDAQLLDVPGRTVLHFPQDDSGGYAGWYASDTDEVIADLDRQIARGATHIVFPESAAWWFEFYEGLDDRFAHRLEEIDGGGFCRIFAVRQPAIASRRGAQ